MHKLHCISNACGTQRVDAQAASNGAIPDELVPCPRPGRGSQRSGGNTDYGAGQPDNQYAQKAKNSFFSASNFFRNGVFSKAAEGFALAEGYYREAGDTQNAANARRNKNLSTCNDRLNYLIVNDPEALRILLGEGKELRNPVVIDGITTFEPMLGACSEFPPEADTIRRKLAALEEEKHATSTPEQSTDNGKSPYRPVDVTQCISSWRKPMNLGYIDWGVKNSCDVAISFDIDDCDMNEDLQAVCTVKTLTVAAHSDYDGSNYHQPANARNYR
ncbi:MAG TPA: hypothetical protein VNY06_01240 [Methylocella sp.]|nr:hypothetical protein [Methylocella sp.]